MRLLVTVGWLVSLVAGAESPRPLPRMALPAVRAEQGVPQGSANLLNELLTADVQRSGRYQVINESDIGSMLGFERQRQQVLGCNDESCLTEIGNALGADLLLAASVGTIGQLRVLVLKLIDVKTGQVKNRLTETLPDDNALVEAGHRMVAKLLGLPVSTADAVSRRQASVFVLGGAGLLTVGGVVLGVSALGSANQFKKSPYNDSYASAAERTALFSDIAYGAALVTAGVAVVLYATGAPPAQASPRAP